LPPVLQKNAVAVKIKTMNDNNRYEWLFFDADGTLFDYDLAEDRALESTFQDLRLPFVDGSRETYRQINRQVWIDFENRKITADVLRTRRFELLFEALHIHADPLAFSAQYLIRLAQQAQLMTGAEAVVRALAGSFRLALITNGLSDVQRPRLALSPIGAYFSEVAISEEIGVAKPAPAYFEAVFDRIAARFPRPAKNRVLVIGDSLSSDIQGGVSFGLPTCWFNPTGQPLPNGLRPTYEIRRLEEVLALVFE